MDKSIAYEIDSYLSNYQVIIRIDNREIPDRGSISDFMKTIREADVAIIIISDAYLKSANCFKEILNFMKNDGYKEKSRTLLLPSAQIFDDNGKLSYIEYWNEKCGEIETTISDPSIPIESKQKMVDTFRYYKEIRDTIGEFIAYVIDRLSPTKVPDFCEKIIIKEHLVKNNEVFLHSIPLLILGSSGSGKSTIISSLT